MGVGWIEMAACRFERGRVAFADGMEVEGVLARRVLDAEIYARYDWEDRVSSGGIPIRVAQLRPSALVRR